MSTATWIPSAKVSEALEALLFKGENDPLAPQFAEICAEAVRLAQEDIVRILTIRGFSESQIQTFDARGRYALDQSIYWSLMRSGVVGTVINKAVADSFDRRRELMDAPALLIGGVAQAPAGNAGGGGISYGRLSKWKKYGNRFNCFGGDLFD